VQKFMGILVVILFLVVWLEETHYYYKESNLDKRSMSPRPIFKAFK